MPHGIIIFPDYRLSQESHYRVQSHITSCYHRHDQTTDGYRTCEEKSDEVPHCLALESAVDIGFNDMRACAIGH